MTRTRNRLAARFVQTVTEPNWYADGGNLYLQVRSGDDGQVWKSWVFRYKLWGRERPMGLGSATDVSLKEARKLASEQRRVLRAGLDPIEERRRRLQDARVADARAITFADCCKAYIDAHGASWRNAKHKTQWQNTLATYAEPVLGKLPVHAIDTPLVLKVLTPIWESKTETATRVRQRIEAVLNWATAREYRTGTNPALWKGHLDKLLAKPAKVKRVKHHPSLPYPEIGAFVASLRLQEGIAARCLEHVILTACRTNEATKAVWSEIDLEAKIWIIPPERMKSGREHRVPLSPRAVEVLKALPRIDDYVFPGPRGTLSNNAMLKVLERMGRSDITTHGFRSTFRTWVAETTAYPREIAEAALGHVLRDRVEAAYQRGDLLEKRRRLMQAWARYCDKPTRKATITSIRGAR